MSIITRARWAIVRATARRRLERDRLRLLIVEERGFDWTKRPIEIRSDFWKRNLVLFEPKEVRMNIRTIDKELQKLDDPAMHSMAA